MKAQNRGKQMTNVWNIRMNVWNIRICGGKERLRDAEGKKLHSTQKPLQLMRRLILATTRRGDVVLDPFLGSGTTLAAARALGRLGVGIEQKAEYVDIARERIAKTRVSKSDVVEKTKLPRRVPMREIMRRKLVRSGRKLYSLRGKENG